jgi:hypothetical protein
MIDTHVYLRDGSYVHDSFEWGFAGLESESDGERVRYQIPDNQWTAFRREFGVSQFQRVNYFEIPDRTNETLDEIGRRVAVSSERIPDTEEGNLQIAGSVRHGPYLYVIVSRHFEDEEGEKTEVVAVAVLRSYSDVVAIRVDTDDRAGAVYTLLQRALGWEIETPESLSPEFGDRFRNDFSKRLAEAYTQVWFRHEGDGEEVNTIHFRGSGDLRDSEIASEYFEKYKLYAGYVRISGSPETEFHFNWSEGRISFQGRTKEEEILEASNQIIAILDLQDGYPVVRTFADGEPIRTEIYDTYYTSVWPADTSINAFVEFVGELNVPANAPIVVDTVEGEREQMTVGDIDDLPNDVSFIRVYAAAEEGGQSDFTWERHGETTLVGVASEDEEATSLSNLYQQSTDARFDNQIVTVLGQLGTNLDSGENYD